MMKSLPSWGNMRRVPEQAVREVRQYCNQKAPKAKYVTRCRLNPDNPLKARDRCRFAFFPLC